MTDNTPGRKIEISLKLGIPTSNVVERPPATLSIFDETARIVILELDLSDAQLVDLLAKRTVYPAVAYANPRPERMGHEQTMWHVVCPTQADADLMRERMRGHGWFVSDTLTRQRTSGIGAKGNVWPVTGRRWDGEQAGTVCPTCRYPLPASWNGRCFECWPVIGKPAP